MILESQCPSHIPEQKPGSSLDSKTGVKNRGQVFKNRGQVLILDLLAKLKQQNRTPNQKARYRQSHETGVHETGVKS